MKLFQYPLFRNYKTDFWISELVAGTFLALYSIALIVILALILINTSILHKTERSLALAREEKRLEAQNLASLRGRAQIYEGIRQMKKSSLTPRVVKKLVDIVAENSERFGYDPLLLLAVINVESRFEKEAMGQKQSGEYSGAMGLMQLKFETALEMAEKLKIPLASEEDLFKPEINIPLGIYYLTRMVVQFEGLPLGIMAYNQGPATVRKGLKGEVPLSRKYYHLIMQSYFKLKDASHV